VTSGRLGLLRKNGLWILGACRMSNAPEHASDRAKFKKMEI